MMKNGEKQGLQHIFSIGYDDSEVEKRLKEVYERIISQSPNMARLNFVRIVPRDLAIVFKSYDSIFFNGHIGRIVGNNLSFRVSQRMTSAGGKTSFNRADKYEITLSAYLLFNSFDTDDEEIIVNGIRCENRLEAAMRVFEHELIHLIEFILFKRSSCSRKQFADAAYAIFRHTMVKHQLMSQKRKAVERYGFKPGDTVSFPFEGQKYQGILHRITKRATVYVPDKNGSYMDNKGTRLKKYYVPLGLLTRMDV